MANFDDELSQFFDNLSALVTQSLPADPIEVNLGGLDSSGNYAVSVTGETGFVYVHHEADGHQDKAFNCNNPIIPDWPCLLYSVGDAKWVVPDPRRLPAFMAGRAQVNAVSPHTHDDPYGGLYDLVSTIRIRAGMVQLVSGLTVRLLSTNGWNRTGTAIAPYDQNAYSDLDLTTNLPSSAGTRRPVMVGKNCTTGAPTAVSGTQVSSAAPFAPSELTSIDLTNIDPWMVVNLRYGQTSIAFADCYDPKPWVSRPRAAQPWYGTGVIKTLSSDKVAAGDDRHIILAAETGITDNVVEITGLTVGDSVLVRADTGDTITVKHNDAGATDKIILYSAADVVLTGDKTLELVKTASGKVIQLMGTGDFLRDGSLAMTGNLTINKADPSVIFNTATASDTDFWAGVQEDAGGDDDDRFQIGRGITPGANVLLDMTRDGDVTFASGRTVSGGIASFDQLVFSASTELTIASGAVTAGNKTFYRIDTEGNAASDDLDTINGGAAGEMLILRADDTARTVVITTAGNIVTPTGGSITLDETYKVVWLIYDGDLSKWVVIGGSSVSALDDLSDVTISSPASGEALLYNGSAWVNSLVDAAIVAYTPADANDWNGAADPGDVNDGLDQLADRVKKLPLGTPTAVTLDASGKFAAGNNRFFTISANTGATDELVEITGLSVGDTVYLLKAAGHSITVNSTSLTATDVIYTPTITPELSENRVAVFRKTHAGVVEVDHFLHDLNSIDGIVDVSKGGTGDDLSAGFPGVLFKETLFASALNLLRYNLTATTNPGVGDDSNDDYGKGSLWVNTSTGAVYLCRDASVGAAVWDRINLQGTVTSVALTMPSDFSVAGSPITSSGTLAVTATNQNANLVKAGPSSGSAAAPTYRALVDADLPTQQKLMPGGRLTLTSLTPVTTSDVTAAQSIYYTPYISDFIALYDGSTKWLGYTFTELEFKITVAKASVGRTSGNGILTGINNADELAVGMEASGTGIGGGAVITSIDSTTQVTVSANSASTGSGTVTFKVPANIPVDLFVQDESGSPQPRMVQWTSSSARASALAYQNGKLVKSADHTMVYVGSALMTGTAGQTEDSEAKRYVWNNYHRLLRKQTIDDTTSHTYASTTARQWRNIATNQVDFFVGLLEAPVQVNLASRMTGNGVLGFAGWALNSTSSLNVANTVGGAFSVDERGATVANVLPALGYNFIAALERGNATGSGPTFESFRLTAGVWG